MSISLQKSPHIMSGAPPPVEKAAMQRVCGRRQPLYLHTGSDPWQQPPGSQTLLLECPPGMADSVEKLIQHGAVILSLRIRWGSHSCSAQTPGHSLLQRIKILKKAVDMLENRIKVQTCFQGDPCCSQHYGFRATRVTRETTQGEMW